MLESVKPLSALLQKHHLSKIQAIKEKHHFSKMQAPSIVQPRHWLNLDKICYKSRVESRFYAQVNQIT